MRVKRANKFTEHRSAVTSSPVTLVEGGVFGELLFLLLLLLAVAGLLDGGLQTVAVRLTLRVLVDGRQAALQAAAAPQGHQQRLWHGEDVQVVAQVDPGQAGEHLGVFEHLGQIFEDGEREAVAVQGERAQFGQRGEQRQEEPQVVVVELGEADVHRDHSVPVGLQVERHLADVSGGERDAGEVERVAGELLLEGRLQAAEETLRNEPSRANRHPPPPRRRRRAHSGLCCVSCVVTGEVSAASRAAPSGKTGISSCKQESQNV